MRHFLLAWVLVLSGTASQSFAQPFGIVSSARDFGCRGAFDGASQNEGDAPSSPLLMPDQKTLIHFDVSSPTLQLKVYKIDQGGFAAPTKVRIVDSEISLNGAYVRWAIIDSNTLGLSVGDSAERRYYTVNLDARNPQFHSVTRLAGARLLVASRTDGFRVEDVSSGRRRSSRVPDQSHFASYYLGELGDAYVGWNRMGKGLNSIPELVLFPKAYGSRKQPARILLADALSDGATRIASGLEPFTVSSDRTYALGGVKNDPRAPWVLWPLMASRGVYYKKSYPIVVNRPLSRFHGAAWVDGELVASVTLMTKQRVERKEAGGIRTRMVYDEKSALLSVDLETGVSAVVRLPDDGEKDSAMAENPMWTLGPRGEVYFVYRSEAKDDYEPGENLRIGFRERGSFQAFSFGRSLPRSERVVFMTRSLDGSALVVGTQRVNGRGQLTGDLILRRLPFQER